MKNLTFKAAALNDGRPTVNRRSTDGQSQRRYSLTPITKRWRALMMVVFLFTLGIGQMWGEEVKLVAVGTTATQSSPDFFDNKTYKSADESYSVNLSTSGTSKSQGGSYDSKKDYYYALGSACDMSSTVSNYFKVAATGCKISKIVVRVHDNSTSQAIFPAVGCVDALPSTSAIGTKNGRKVDVIIDDQKPNSYGSVKRFANATTLTYTFSTNVSEVYFSKQIKAVGLADATAWATYPASSAQSVCLYGIDVYVVPEATADVAPEITAPTTDQSAVYTVGDAITALSVTATGTPAPTYQWYYNSSASTEGATSLGSGAQTASYTPSNAAESDLYYYCIATNSEGSAQSPYFHVEVNAAVATAPSFTSPASEPAVAEYSVGDAISALEVVAAGYPAPTLQWYSNSSKSTEGATLITGAESASYTPSNAAVSDLYFYCVATNASGTAQSEYFHVTVAAVSYCAELVPATSGEAIAVGDIIDLQTGSNGGTMTATNLGSGNLAYHANGLGFNSKSGPTVKVVLNHNMQVGTKLWIKLMAAGADTRGLTLKTKTGTTISAFTCWVKDVNGATNGDVETFTYTVVAGDGLEGTNEFQLVRNNSVWLQSLKVSNCGAELLALTSAVSVAGKATVTLNKSFVEAGGSATAAYSEIDAAYEFDGWEITTGDATIADPTAATAAITMGTTASTITLKLKAASVKYTVHFNSKGGSAVADQLIESGEYASVPTAPTKFKYTFGGWSETDGGSTPADLGAIAITGEKTFYAIWTEKVCPTSGTIYSFVSDGTKAPGSNTYCPASGVQGVVDIATYATVSGGLAQAVHTTTSNNPAQIQTSTSAVKLSHADGYFRALLECPLQEGDTIKFVKTNKVKMAFDSLRTKVVEIASGTGANKDYYIVPAGYAGEDTIMVYYAGSSVNLTSLKVVRPEKLAVTFNMHGHGDAVDAQTIVKGGKVTEPDPAPSAEGYSFDGWYATYVADPESYDDAWDFANDVVSAATELHAKWTAWPTMTLNRGAATSGDDVVTSVEPGSVVTVPACPFSYTDYNFNGWAYSPAVTMVDETHFTMPSENLTLTAQWVDANNVAQIGSTKYATFAEAAAAVADGETIQLLQDCDYDATWTITGMAVTLDLNGKNLTNATGDDAVAIKTGGKLTIMDGTATIDPTINGSNEVTYAAGKFTSGGWLINVYNGAEFVMNSGWLLAQEAAVYVEKTAIATVNNGVLEALDNAVIMGHGKAERAGYTINVHGGILLGHIQSAGYASMVIYHPNIGTLNIDGGKLISTNGPAVVIRGGESNITGGEIIAQGSGEGKCGDASQNLGAVGIVTDFKSAYPGVANTDVAISGDVEVTGEAGAVQAIYAATEPTATEEAAVAISGGTFSSPVAEALCADDYYPATKPSGKYGVTVAALSVNFAEEAAKTEGQKAWTTFLTDNHYDYNLGDGGEISWDKANAYDTGLKLKKSTNNAIYFTTEPGKLIELTVGNIAGMNIQINGGTPQTITGGTNNDNLGVSYYYSDNAQSVVLKETSGNSGYNMLKSINIRDPYTVSFNANGGDAVASLKATPAINLPSATNGTQNFAGWYDALDNFIGNAGAPYTPTANIELVAHWEALSTVNTLSDLQVDGVTVDGFASNVHTYYIVVPYGTAVADLPKITSATPTNANASVAIWPTEGPQWTDDFGGCYRQQANVTPQDPNAAVGYNDIRITIGPKDMMMMIKATHDGTTTGATVEGYFGGEKDKKTANNGKLGVKDNYMGIKLAEEAGTFKAGDVLKIYAPTPSAKVRIYSDKGTTRINPTDGTFDSEKMFTYTLTDDEEWIYLYRLTDDESDMNPTLGYMAVYRAYPNPLVETIIFNGAVATVDNDLKTITVEVPASTDFGTMPVVATFLSNDPSLTNGAVTGGTWAEGDNEYVVTDKDNDQTVYTVTISKAVASNDATLSALSYGTPATAIALADGVYEYNVELPYGTSDVPALAATAHHAGASVTNIADATAFVNRHATSTVTVTAEDGTTTQTYTVNFTISAWKEVVIWDGSYMTELATSPGDLGMAWEVNGFGSISSYSTTTYGEKAYTKYLPSGGTAPGRYMTLTVPAGYVAKFYVVMASHSTGNERGMFIGSNLVKDPDATSVLELSNNDRDNAVAGMSEIVGAGTWYINPNASIDIQEIRAYLRPGYARTSMLGNGVYGTVCVDHNVAFEDIQGATFYELVGQEPTYGKIAFDEIIAGQLDAGKPYLFQANGDKLILFYGEEIAPTPDNSGALKGTYTDITIAAGDADDIYFFRDHALWSAKETGVKILANRAWLDMSVITPASPTSNPARRRVTMAINGKDTATGIDNLEASEKPLKLMINGQMYILRGEKLFDATGRLVK